jgi:hypothetical protein
MTDSPSPASAAPEPPRRGRRGSVGFLAGCLLVFVLVATGLHFLGPRSAPPGVTMTDLHGVAHSRPGSTPTAASRGWW